MMRSFRFLQPLLLTLLVFFTGLTSQTYAAAKVEGLQLPAWVERNKIRRALKPGFQLATGDIVATGATGKLLIRTDDGSAIKLGVNAKFNFKQLETSSDSIVQGIWKVLSGAFRYTTATISTKRKRDLAISVGAATIGIRGTDIWGRSNDQQDLVCLIEGNIEITRGSDAPVAMADPLSVYTAPRNGPANPLESIDTIQLNKWGAETELLEGQGVLNKLGDYVVYLLSAQQQSYAEAKQQALQTAGYPAEVTLHAVDGAEWYRVGVAGFLSWQDAQVFIEQMNGVLDIQGAWAARKK